MRLSAVTLTAVNRFWRAHGGAVAPLWAMAMLALGPMSAVVIDTTYAWSAKRGLQDALDSALLAVARAGAESQSDIDAIARKYIDANIQKRYGATVSKIEIKLVGDGEYVGAVYADVPSFLAKMFGVNGLEAGVNGSVRVNNDDLDVVLSLDTTGSMSGARIAALKDAARNFVNTMFEDDPDNIRIGIVPFARYVNIGMVHRNEPGFRIPADSRVCGMEMVEKRINKRNCVRRTENRTCNDDGRSYSCTREREECDYDTITVEEEVCHSQEWEGCVGSRRADLNVRDTGALADGVPGVMNNSCGTPLLRLTKNKSDLLDRVQDLSVGDETYLPVGLSMGWATLSDRAPFTEGLPPGGGAKRGIRAIVLMTDGLNTVSIRPVHNGQGYHEDNDTTVANGVTASLCTNVKADNVLVFTIAFDVTDAGVRTLLRNCATSPGMFFTAESASELRKAFKDIAGALSRLRLTD
jgi:Flp pilus assembly protein TadG